LVSLERKDSKVRKCCVTVAMEPDPWVWGESRSLLRHKLNNPILFFFQEGTVTNSAIWLVLYAVLIFLSLLMGMVTLTWVRVLLFTKPFKRKSFFSKLLFIGQQSLKTKAFFSEQIFIAILKWINSSLQRRFVYCICEARRVCAGGSEIMKKLVWEKEGKKIASCSLFNTLVKAFLLYGPPNRQITIFSSCIPTQNAKMGWWGFILDFPLSCR